ncbi:MAG: putative oxidoreductase, partial [Labilithrix sp.]|nr:putative oxidoreductase [Labilithrix sp.]
QVETHMRHLTIVDEESRPLVRLPSSFASGEVEIQRGDLSRILYEASAGTEYIFDDSIASVTQSADGVAVTFQRGRPRKFDLVVGADGLHSRVRALVFGDESKFIRFHGYYVAGFTAPNHLDLDREGRIFSVPGRSASISNARHHDEATALFVFASKRLDYCRHSIAQQKRIVAERYAGIGWEVPRLLEAMQNAPDLYFDAIAQVDLERYSTGRVVLLGDAGYGGTIGGQGTGLAIVCSYVLAGELALANGDHRAAFARYEDQIRSYALACQQGAKRVGPFFAPPTRTRTWLRNQVYRALTSRPLLPLFEKLVTSSASAITLRDYPRELLQSPREHRAPAATTLNL